MALDAVHWLNTQIFLQRFCSKMGLNPLDKSFTKLLHFCTGDHSFSMYPKVSVELTFLHADTQNVRVRIRGTDKMNNPHLFFTFRENS